MQRSVLLLGAMLIAALGFACVPPPPPPPGPAPLVDLIPHCTAKGIAAGNDFVGKMVQVASIDPQHAGGPIGAGSSASGSLYATEMANAFDDAPSSFKDQLCTLNAVFINTYGCAQNNGILDCSAPDALQNSWALRENLKRNPNRAGRFIALSGALWSGGQPVSYRTFETAIFDELTGWPPNNDIPVYTPSNDPDDTPTTTVLAALAHEYGHVYWYDTFDPNRTNPNYDPNSFCPAAGGFFTKSWSGSVHMPPRWRKFAGVGQDQHSPAEVALVRDIAAAKRSGDWTDPSKDVDAIYAIPGTWANVFASGTWASLFATFSPDEDFVETFKLAVLLNAKAPLQHLPLQIPDLGVTEDIPGTLSKRSDLQAKIACFPMTP